MEKIQKVTNFNLRKRRKRVIVINFPNNNNNNNKVNITGIILTIISVVNCSIISSSNSNSNSGSGSFSASSNVLLSNSNKNNINNPPTTKTIGLLYDSSNPIQYKLYLATWIGFRDAIQSDSDPAPIIIDFKHGFNNKETIQWIKSNYTKSIISLLDEPKLLTWIKEYEEEGEQDDHFKSNMPQPLRVILVRNCIQNPNFQLNLSHNNNNQRKFISIECLKMNSKAIASVIINRMNKIGTTAIIPIMIDNTNNYSTIMEEYQKQVLLQSNNNNNNIQIISPIVTNLQQIKQQLMKLSTSSSSAGIGGIAIGNGFNGTQANITNTTISVALLILSKNPKSIAKILEYVTKLNDTNVLIHSFSPWGIEPLLELYEIQQQQQQRAPSTALFTGSSSIYTVEYVGSTEWDNPPRRRILTELNKFFGTSPLILTAILAYDAVFQALSPNNNGNPPRLPLSGEFIMNPSDNTRSEGVFFGLSPKPTTENLLLLLLLQPSNFILEDLITISSNNYKVVNYQVATSSLISKEELISLAFIAEARVADCNQQHLKITTHDPFNQQSYLYEFKQYNLPEYLLLPNQYGYGLELSCLSTTSTGNNNNSKDVTSTSILIACTPNGKSFQEPVHCFKSNPHRRVKRQLRQPSTKSPLNKNGQSYRSQSHYNGRRLNTGQGGGAGDNANGHPAANNRNNYNQYYNGYNLNNYGYDDDEDDRGRSSFSSDHDQSAAANAGPTGPYYYLNPNSRDDNANNLYYQPAISTYYEQPPEIQSSTTGPYYYYDMGMGGYVDSSTAGYLTSHVDNSMNADDPQAHPSTDAPPPPPPPPPSPSKLPELRQVLKAAKPFMGSCIGSTTGCAMCVLVLGRLPLGAVPAACTGPCFVGTFGSCGSLLGRVFAETTIICTELFKQGHLDISTFIADAEFGRILAHQDPMTLKGYQYLATPLVESMRYSSFITSIVAKFASSWALHMKYLVGHSNETDWVGSFIHSIGAPICKGTGFMLEQFETQTNQNHNQSFINLSLNYINIYSIILGLLSFFIMLKIWRRQKL